MVWILFMGVFCVSLAFFLYARKSRNQAVPDHSYILFKDYAAEYSKPLTVPDTKAEKVAPERVIVTPRDERAKGTDKEKGSIVPTLHFED